MIIFVSKYLHMEIKPYNLSQFNSVDSIFNHKNLMKKYFNLSDGELLLIIGDYFGVTSAFLSLRAFICDENFMRVKEDVKKKSLDASK